MLKTGIRPVHPGETLQEDYIKPMGVSMRAFAVAPHVPCSRRWQYQPELQEHGSETGPRRLCQSSKCPLWTEE